MRVTTKWDPAMTVFIGRPGPYGNPFYMRTEDDREEVITRFEKWARSTPWMLDRIAMLPPNSVLGCYCAPKRCHGDVIIKIWKEQNHGRV